MPTNELAIKYRTAAVKETVFGTTPASPLNVVRTTGASGRVTKTRATSDELHLFEVSDLITLDATGRGTIKGELSYGGVIENMWESLYGTAWSSDQLKVGATVIGLTIEDQLTGLAKFLAYKGCIIESIKLTVQQGAKITYEIAYVATIIPTAFASATVGTGAIVAAPTNKIMSPVTSVQLFNEGSGPTNLLTNGVVSTTFEFSRPAILMPQIGSLNQSDMGLGTFELKISVQMYANTVSLALIDKYLSDTDTLFNFTLGGSSTKKYAWTMSVASFIDAGVNEPSKNSALTTGFQVQALFDPTNSTALMTRTP